MKRAAILVLVALFAALFAQADDKKDEKNDDKTSHIKVTVLKEETGKPVRNASVIFHPVKDNGKQARAGLQTKTDSEGRASVEFIPYGKLRMQVIARGLQTYGEDFEVNQPAHDFVVKLKPPQQQFSIYENKDQPPKDEKKQ